MKNYITSDVCQCNGKKGFYGPGDFILAIKEGVIRGYFFDKITYRICICRGCGQYLKAFTAWSTNGIVEEVKPIDEEEFKSLLSKKFPKSSSNEIQERLDQVNERIPANNKA